MKLLATLGLVVALLVAPTFNAAADTYYEYTQWGGTWHDANKIYPVSAANGDSNLCWAAAASNILDWSKWGTAAYNTETAIFQYFKGNWTNLGGLPQYGWQWWFTGTNGMQGVDDWAQLTATGSGNFFPRVSLANFLYAVGYDAGSPTSNLMAIVDGYFQKGYGVSLGIYERNTKGGWDGHAVTAWGFNYAGQGSDRTYTSIYITDSDDGVTGLMNYLITWDPTNQWWNFGGGYAGWHIANVRALDRQLPLAGAGDGSDIPVPATLVLLGSGLLGLAGWRIKFGQA